MTTIYLIRHAEAEGNLYRRAQGQYDSTITALGRQQLLALRERFRDVPIDELWSSDLTRARTTALAVQETHPHLALNTTPALREVAIGIWEDVPWGNLDRDWPEEMKCFASDPDRWQVEGSERFPTLTDRMESTLLALTERRPGGTIAVVSHGMAIRALLCRLLGVPSEEVYRVPHGDNTCVAVLEAEDGRLRVRSYNDNSHLEQGGLSTFARQVWWKRETGSSGDRDNLVFSPLDPTREEALYTRCYRETWCVSHGSTEGFCAPIYVRTARRHARENPLFVYKAEQDGRFVGLVELEAENGAAENTGRLCLLYVEEELRRGRLGVQLLGHAVSVFRAMGRRAITLHVSRTNTNAIAFYERCGFVRVRADEGVGGPLWLMEMDITVRVPDAL